MHAQVNITKGEAIEGEPVLEHGLVFTRKDEYGNDHFGILFVSAGSDLDDEESLLWALVDPAEYGLWVYDKDAHAMRHFLREFGFSVAPAGTEVAFTNGR